jgi:hypothetical protein
MEPGETKMRTLVGSLGLIAALTFGATVALADPPATNNGHGDGSNASASGAGHGAFADVNGNFGFLGDAGGTPGYHNGATGQEAGATGSNNSHCCGVGQDEHVNPAGK